MPSTSALPLISRLHPRGILSFGPDFPGIDLRAMNLLIGPNGSGKSNLIDTIDLLRAAPKDWRDVTRKAGGAAEWIHKGGSEHTASVALTFARHGAGTPILHEMAFRTVAGRFDLTVEEIRDEGHPETGGSGYYSTSPLYVRPMVARVTSDGEQDWGTAPETAGRSILALLRDPQHYPEMTWLSESYESIRIYREWAFGRGAVLREPQKADMRNDMLDENFSNLGLFLNRLRTKHPAAKKAILNGLNDLYDGIQDFDVFVEGGTVQVFFTEGDFSIPATRLSDGTLRYLCLLAILCDPDPPKLVCIEEPELGLHPDILPKVADLLRKASERTQLIVTTHSDILVDAITETPEAVVVCSKVDGQTKMARLRAEDLQEWLKKYRLGQLWTKGEIGGTRW